MQVSRINLYHVRIPLRLQFAQANQNTATSDSVIIRIKSQDGTLGHGECCPRRYVTGEDVPQVIETINSLSADLQAQTFTELDDIRQWVFAKLKAGYGHAAICGIELALLDAWSWETQTDLMEALGGYQHVERRYSGVLPYGDWAKLSPVISRFNFGSWKFKAYHKLEDNWQRVRDLQNTLGETVQLRTDANGGWTLEEARDQIATGLDLGLRSFEQPVPAGQDDKMGQLVAEFGDQATIMADESLISYEDAVRLVALGQCNHFNLKISKNGGILNTLRIYTLAQQNGIPCQLGAHYGETSILTAAGQLFAAVAPNLTALEGGLGTYLLQDDITTRPLMIDADGILPPSDLPTMGWPVLIDPLRLNRYSIRTQSWETPAAISAEA